MNIERYYLNQFRSDLQIAQQQAKTFIRRTRAISFNDFLPGADCCLNQIDDPDKCLICFFLFKEFTVRIQPWTDITGLRDAEMIERIFTAMHGEIAMEALGTLGRSNEQVNYFSHQYSLEDLGKRLVIIRDALYTMV